MAKPSQGRFDGIWGMETFTAAELNAIADRYEAEANNPETADDPKWLRRRAARLRRVATAKEKAIEQKSAERRS